MKLLTLTKIALAIAVFQLGFNVSIANAQNQQTSNVTIDRMVNFGSAGGEALFIITEEEIVNPGLCTRNTRYFLTDASSDISRSMLLAAKVNNTPVKLTISGASCPSDYPAIVAVELPES